MSDSQTEWVIQDPGILENQRQTLRLTPWIDSSVNPTMPRQSSSVNFEQMIDNDNSLVSNLISGRMILKHVAAIDGFDWEVPFKLR